MEGLCATLAEGPVVQSSRSPSLFWQEFMKNSLLTGTGTLVSLDFVHGRLCVSLEEGSTVLSSKSLVRLSLF